MKKTLLLFAFALMATTMRGQFTDERLAEFPSDVRAMVGNSWRIMLAVRDGRTEDVRPLLAPDFRMGGKTGKEAFGVLDSVARRREVDSLRLVRVKSIDDRVIVEMTMVQGGEYREVSLQGGRDGLVTAIGGLTRSSIYDDPDPLLDARVVLTFEGIQTIAEQDSVSVPFSLWHDCMVLTLWGDGRELTFLFDTGCNLTQLNSAYHHPDNRGLVRLDSLRIGPNIYSLETEPADLSRMERQLTPPTLDRLPGDVAPADSVTIAWYDHEQTAPTFRIQRLTLGSIEAQSPVVQSFADPRFPEADGILDIRFFARRRISLNYVTRQLRVYWLASL